MDPVLKIRRVGEDGFRCVSAAKMLAILIQEVQNANGGICIVGSFEFDYEERQNGSTAPKTEAQTPSEK